MKMHLSQKRLVYNSSKYTITINNRALWTEHANSKILPLQYVICVQMCRAKFATRSELQYHKNIHLKKISCDVCGSFFSHLSTFQIVILNGCMQNTVISKSDQKYIYRQKQSVQNSSEYTMLLDLQQSSMNRTCSQHYRIT